ncbi:hypothetical protein GF345_00895 [Candidatus Woesearchaeota archaeon]|nr:hypothetical protein [Candidatus Woesearchaeota archaeon]
MMGSYLKKRYGLPVLLVVLALFACSVTAQFSIEGSPIKSNFTYTSPENVTREDALDALIEAEGSIEEMKEYNLSHSYADDVLLIAQRSYIGEKFSYIEDDLAEEKDRRKSAYLIKLQNISRATPDYEVREINHSKVLLLTQLIEYRTEQAFRILDYLPVVEEKEELYRQKGANTTQGLEVLIKARTAFREERYDEAEALLEKANNILDDAFFEHRRATAITNLTKNFILKYWWQIIVILVIIAIITPPAVRRTRAVLAANKIKRLKIELDSLKDSLKKAQEERFVKFTLTDKSYHARSEKYMDRMTEIKHTIPVLEAILQEQNKPRKGIRKRVSGSLQKINKGLRSFKEHSVNIFKGIFLGKVRQYRSGKKKGSRKKS